MAVWGMRVTTPIRYMIQSPPSEDEDVSTIIHRRGCVVIAPDGVTPMGEVTQSEHITPLGAKVSCASACHC